MSVAKDEAQEIRQQISTLSQRLMLMEEKEREVKRKQVRDTLKNVGLIILLVLVSFAFVAKVLELLYVLHILDKIQKLLIAAGSFDLGEVLKWIH